MSKVFQWSWTYACVLVMCVLTTHRMEGQDSTTASRPPVVTFLRPVTSTPWNAQSEWAGRLIIGEYGTGSACAICKFLDEAVDGLSRRYPATQFIGLSYHMDYDRFMSDPADSVLYRKDRWYGGNGTYCENATDKTWGGQVPLPCNMWIWITIGGRGSIPDPFYPSLGKSISLTDPGVVDTLSQFFYNRMAAGIDSELLRAPEAFFHVQTTVRGGKINIGVKVDSLKGNHPQLVLRLLLVEDTLTLHPSALVDTTTPVWALNREQYMLVYATAHTPALALGVPLPGPGTMKYTFDVAAIQRRLLSIYHGDMTWVNPIYKKEWVQEEKARFPSERDWRLNPMRLHVIAMIQDLQSGEILQASMVPVDGKRLVLK